MNNKVFRVKDAFDLPILKTLDPYMVEHTGFIAGGCFKNVFSHEKIKDLDIFFNSEADWLDAVEHFTELTEETSTWVLCYENEKVKAFKNLKTNIILELCRTIFGTPEQVLSQFDFTITKFAYVKTFIPDGEGGHWEYQAVYHEDFFEHLTQHRLVLDDKILFPMSTFDRMFRYAKYGYRPCRYTKLKIVEALRDLSQTDVSLPRNFYDGMD